MSWIGPGVVTDYKERVEVLIICVKPFEGAHVLGKLVMHRRVKNADLGLA